MEQEEQHQQGMIMEEVVMEEMDIMDVVEGDLVEQMEIQVMEEMEVMDS